MTSSDGRVVALPTEARDDPASAPWASFTARSTGAPLNVDRTPADSVRDVPPSDRDAAARYTLDGRVHPSPLLTGAGRHFALIQPLPPLKSVALHLELYWEGGGRTRLPVEGELGLRVGLPGLRRRNST